MKLSPIGWMMLGGIVALTLAPTVRKAVQETDITNKSFKEEVSIASNAVLGKVKRNFNSIVDKTDLEEEFDNLRDLKDKIRVRKRNRIVGSIRK